MAISNKIFKYKKLIFILLYFLVLPIIFIPSIYISTYSKNKPIVFGDTENKITTPDKLASFSLDVYATNYTNATEDETGAIYLTAEISDIKLNISNVTLQFEIDTPWQSNKITSTTTRQFNTGAVLIAGEEYTLPYYVLIPNIETVYPKKVLPFVIIHNPYVYAKVTWKEAGENKTAIVYYKYDEYVKTGVTIVS